MTRDMGSTALKVPESQMADPAFAPTVATRDALYLRTQHWQ